jgi:hypothetical protein
MEKVQRYYHTTTIKHTCAHVLLISPLPLLTPTQQAIPNDSLTVLPTRMAFKSRKVSEGLC